jgi:hypothetical protein
VTIEQVIDEIETAARRFRFIQAVVQIDVTRFSVKYRLAVENDLYVQIYVNVRNGTTGLAFVHQGRRLYGRDSENWQWHRHPVNDPQDHDFSGEGTRPVSIEEFLLEVGEILVSQGLI